MSVDSGWFKQEPFGAFWERGYRNLKVSSMGGPSFEVAEIFPALPKNAKVLDLGAGEGRNALFLAGKGCEVTAVDRSSAGISKLNAIAKEHQIPIKAIVQDISLFPITEEYDLIMAHGVLYYLQNDQWRQLLTKVKKHTRQGGFNIFTLFVYNEKYPCVEEIEAASYAHSFQPNELQTFYQDWIEHRYDQYVKWDSHPGIALHYHPIEKLVAQKPLAKIKKEKIMIGNDISEEDFKAINMEMDEGELIHRIGHPHAIEMMHMEGMQLGSTINDEKSNSQSVVNGYQLDLWFYGRFVFYIANGQVAGKSHYTTEPIRLLFEEH